MAIERDKTLGDDYFELMMRNAWHIAGGEELKQRNCWAGDTGGVLKGLDASNMQAPKFSDVNRSIESKTLENNGKYLNPAASGMSNMISKHDIRGSSPREIEIQVTNVVFSKNMHSHLYRFSLYF